MSFSHSNWLLSAGGFIAENVRKMLNPPVGHVRAKRCIHALPAQKQSHTCAHRGRTDINIAKMLAKMPIDWQKYFNANRLAKIAKILAKVTSRTSGDRRSESQNFGNVKVHKYTCTCCRHIFLNFKATGGNVLVVCASERGTFVRCWNFPEQTTTNFLAASARLLPKFWHFRWKHITTSLQILGACTPTKVTMASKNMKLLRGCDPRNTENWHPTCPSTIHTFSKHIFLDSARKIVQIRLFFDFVCEVICLSPALPFMTSLHHTQIQNNNMQFKGSFLNQ